MIVISDSQLWSGVRELEYACIDGNMDHLHRGYSLLKVGTQDAAHRYRTLAYCIMTGREREKETLLFLECLDEYLIKSGISPSGFTPHMWMVDGARGLREGISKWYAKKDSSKPLKLAMCFRHVLSAIKEPGKYFPRRHLDESQAIWDIKRLSELPPALFARGWQCVRKKWEENGWNDFLVYFEKTWILGFPGWNVLTLARGRGNTNNGTEGSWPVLHMFIHGKKLPITLAQSLISYLIPHHVRNLRVLDEKPRPLTLEERTDALSLAQETNDVLYREGKYYYCRKRVAGIRPQISEADIKQYELSLIKVTWDYDADFGPVTSTRKFNENECNCKKESDYQIVCIEAALES